MSIDTSKHRREIGRHIRNGNYEETPGGILIDRGGMNALANGSFLHTLYHADGGIDRVIDPNLVVNEGLDYILNVAFAGQAAVTGWFIALFSGNVNPAPGWNGSNWVAAATEQVNYASTTRPAWVLPGATNTQSIGNSGSEAMFEFTGSGNNAYGASLVSASAKGATSGRLFAATKFSAPRLNLAAPDKLGVQYVVTAQDAGS